MTNFEEDLIKHFSVRMGKDLFDLMEKHVKEKNLNRSAMIRSLIEAEIAKNSK